MHSFSIWPAITFESVFNVQRSTHMARSFRRPNSTTSYSAMLLLHLSASTVNYSRATYLNLMPEGDFSITVAPAPKTPQAPSQYTFYGMSTIVDEDWYSGYHPAWTQKTQGGVRYDSSHHLKDFRGPWCALQDVNNYIYKNIYKIGK
jgi:hypothetical protein